MAWSNNVLGWMGPQNACVLSQLWLLCFSSLSLPRSFPLSFCSLILPSHCFPLHPLSSLSLPSSLKITGTEQRPNTQKGLLWVRHHLWWFHMQSLIRYSKESFEWGLVFLFYKWRNQDALKPSELFPDAQRVSDSPEADYPMPLLSLATSFPLQTKSCWLVSWVSWMGRALLGTELHHHGNRITCLGGGMVLCLARMADVRERCSAPGRCYHLSENVPFLSTAKSLSYSCHFKWALSCSVQLKIRMTTIYQTPPGCQALCNFSFPIHVTSLWCGYCFPHLYQGKRLRENCPTHSHRKQQARVKLGVLRDQSQALPHWPQCSPCLEKTVTVGPQGPWIFLARC